MPIEKDNWRPNASRKTLQHRANTLTAIRAFFSEKSVMEVETPAMSQYGNTDPTSTSFVTSAHNNTSESPRYLHTSPEFAMKRLLAADVGDIFQICKVFRQGESGRYHNPEFTLLEWYRMGFDYHQLIDEVAELVRMLLPAEYKKHKTEKISYREAFKSFLKVDPLEATIEELQSVVSSQGLQVETSLDNDKNTWLDLMMSHYVQPRLGQQCITFVYDYPASQSALARVRYDDPPVAERFELFVSGLELANGYQELTNHNEQKIRFAQEQTQRKHDGSARIPYDENLLSALESGLQPCAGVALGLDRLLMLIVGEKSLKNVLAFSENRA